MIKIIPILLLMTTSAYAAQAVPEFIKNDSQRPVSQISQELGVTSDQFTQCFNNVRPATDFAPTADRQKQNKNILLPCLQKSNSTLTNGRLDEVMDKYRPKK